MQRKRRSLAFGAEKLAHRLTAAIFVLMLPVFAVGLYARPSADDFVYGELTHRAVQEGGSLWNVLCAAWETNLYYFNNWQGLYVSGFTLSLVPSIWNETLYALTPFLVLAFLLFSLWGMFHFLKKRFLPAAPKGTAFFCAALAWYAFAQGMPSPVEGLYWFNGAMNYIPYFCLCLLNVGIMTELYGLSAKAHLPRAGWLFLSCVLSVVISGGHQVTAALNLLLLLGALALFAKGRRAWPLLPFMTGLFGLLVNLTSPGTAVRQSGFSGASLPEAVVKSFILAALEWVRWLDVPLLCLLALATPLLLRAVKGEGGKHLNYRLWLLAPAATFVLMWAMIFLPSYSMGGIGPGRLINVVWMTFVLGVLCSWAGLLGYLVNEKKLPLPKLPADRKTGMAALALLLCMACIGSHTVKEGLDNHFATSLEALYELAEGTPQRFAAALDARAGALNDPDQPEVTVTTLTEEQRPYLLFFNDATSETGPLNMDVYYGKSVTVKTVP